MSEGWHMPRLMRPYRNFIVAVAPLLKDDAYLDMDENTFIGKAMKASGGTLNPRELKEAYQTLRAEAGMRVEP